MSKAKIYQGIVCLEITSPNGSQWWYQTGRLAYTPARIANMQKLIKGYVGVRQVWAVPVQAGRTQTMVALNMPRTDVWGLKKAGLLPPDFPLPNTPPVYEPWPAYAQQHPDSVM